MPAYQILLAKSQKKSYRNALMFGALLNIVLNTILVSYLSYIGTAISVVATEIIITLLLNIAVVKYLKREKYE